MNKNRKISENKWSPPKKKQRNILMFIFSLNFALCGQVVNRTVPIYKTMPNFLVQSLKEEI